MDKRDKQLLKRFGTALPTEAEIQKMEMALLSADRLKADLIIKDLTKEFSKISKKIRAYKKIKFIED